jgi:hypothetical protein
MTRPHAPPVRDALGDLEEPDQLETEAPWVAGLVWVPAGVALLYFLAGIRRIRDSHPTRRDNEVTQGRTPPALP